MTTFRWLHLTDLHVGMPGQASLWPNMEEIFLQDLAFLREQVGTWDLVLFTGDLTQSGGKSEFDELDRMLQRFWARFKEWGFTPEFFTVPGNHDLVRPTNTSDPTLITLLHSWSLPDVQNPFWEDATSPQRSLITKILLTGGRGQSSRSPQNGSVVFCRAIAWPLSMRVPANWGSLV